MSGKNGLNFMQNTFSLESEEPHADDSRHTFQSQRAYNNDALLSHTLDEDLSVDCLKENARRFDQSVKRARYEKLHPIFQEAAFREHNGTRF